MKITIDFGPDASAAIRRMASAMGRGPAEAVHDLALAAAVLRPEDLLVEETRILKQPRKTAPRTAGNRPGKGEVLEWSYENLRRLHKSGLTDREMASRFLVPNKRVAAARRRLGLLANRDNR